MAKSRYGIDDLLSVGAPQAITVLAGPHIYDHDLALHHLTKVFSDRYGGEHEVLRFSGRDLNISQALSELSGGGFFSTATLAILRDYPDRKETTEVLLRWSENVPADVNVVMCFPDSSLSSSVVKELTGRVPVFFFADPKGREYRVRAAKLIKDRSFSLDESAAEILFSGFEGDLSALSNELDKIGTYLGSRRTLKRSDLEQISNVRANANKFELVDKIVHGRRPDALDLLERLLREGEQAHVLLAIVGTEVRKILCAVSMLKRDMPTSDVLERLQIRFYTDRFMARVEAVRNKWDACEVLRVLTEADRHLKTSMKPPELVMEAAICALVVQ